MSLIVNLLEAQIFGLIVALLYMAWGVRKENNQFETMIQKLDGRLKELERK